jgi:putative FmdB family regulatory protein
MPRYVYRCTECEELSTINHSSDEVETKCPKCAADRGLVKLLTNFTTRKKGTKSNKIGQVTEQFIKDSRQELQQQKKQLNKNK